jgi:hypothetical protein
MREYKPHSELPQLAHHVGEHERGEVLKLIEIEEEGATGRRGEGLVNTKTVAYLSISHCS